MERSDWSRAHVTTRLLLVQPPLVMRVLPEVSSLCSYSSVVQGYKVKRIRPYQGCSISLRFQSIPFIVYDLIHQRRSEHALSDKRMGLSKLPLQDLRASVLSMSTMLSMTLLLVFLMKCYLIAHYKQS